MLDWQSDVNAVYLYCPDVLGAGLLALTPVDTETWEAVLTNNTGAPVGEYPGVLYASSTNSGTIALYDKVIIDVDHILWVKTWGGIDWDVGHSVTTDINDNVYTAGFFQGTVDFGDGNPITAPAWDAYIVKLDSEGNFIWVKILGLNNSSFYASEKISVVTDGDTDVYITGDFKGTVDFGDGNPISSHGNEDAYLLKLDSNGNFIRVRTWGGTSSDHGWSVITNSVADVYVTGYFQGSVDFGDGNPVASLGGYDVFLSKFDSSVDFIQVKSWGGTGSDMGRSVATNSTDDVYVAGNNGDDLLLLKYDSNGNFIWDETYGGSTGYSVAIDLNDDIYVAGQQTSNDSVLLIKWDSDGSVIWDEIYDKPIWQIGYSVAIDTMGHAYVCGQSRSGSGCLIRWDAEGNFDWIENFSNYAFSVTTDTSDAVIVTGCFYGTHDYFDDGNIMYSNGDQDVCVFKFPAR